MILSASFKFININSLNFFFYSYLICYISGPAAINIYVTLLSIFGLYKLILNYFTNKLFISNLSKILIIFYLYIFLNELFIDNFNFHYFSFLRYLIIFLLFENIALKESKLEFKYLFIILFIIALDGIYQFFNGSNILGFDKFDNFRLTGIFGDEPIIGSFLMKFIIPIIWIYFLEKNKLIKNIFYIILLSLVFSCMILSFERMPIIQIFLAIGMMLIFSIFKDRNISKKILFTGFLVTLSAYFLIINNNFLKYRTQASIDALYNIFILNDHSKNQLISIKDYVGHINLSKKLWIENVYTGGGYRYFNKFCSSNDNEVINVIGCSTHPHNIYLELLTNAGLVGLLIFCIFNSYLIFLSFNRVSKRYFGFIFTYLALIFPLVTSQSIYSSYYGSIFFLFIFLFNYFLNMDSKK